MRKRTTEEFIEKAIEIHGDKYDYSDVVFDGNDKEVIIYCKKHKENPRHLETESSFQKSFQDNRDQTI